MRLPTQAANVCRQFPNLSHERHAMVPSGYQIGHGARCQPGDIACDTDKCCIADAEYCAGGTCHPYI
jgi:hypothetical protein